MPEGERRVGGGMQVLFGRRLLKLTGRAETTEACRTAQETVDRPVSLGNFLSVLGRAFVSTAGCRGSGIALRVIAVARSGSSARRHPPPPPPVSNEEANQWSPS